MISSNTNSQITLVGLPTTNSQTSSSSLPSSISSSSSSATVSAVFASSVSASISTSSPSTWTANVSKKEIETYLEADKNDKLAIKTPPATLTGDELIQYYKNAAILAAYTFNHELALFESENMKQQSKYMELQQQNLQLLEKNLTDKINLSAALKEQSEKSASLFTMFQEKQQEVFHSNGNLLVLKNYHQLAIETLQEEIKANKNELQLAYNKIATLQRQIKEKSH